MTASWSVWLVEAAVDFLLLPGIFRVLCFFLIDTSSLYMIWLSVWPRAGSWSRRLDGARPVKETVRLSLQVSCLLLPLVVVEARAGLIIWVTVQGPWRLLLLDEPEKGEGAFIKALSQLFWFQTYLV